MNPYISDLRSMQRTDNYSLEYLKEISKSVTLVIKNEEEATDEADKESTANEIKPIENRKKNSKRIDRKSRVSFKEILVEPEEKQIGN